jgi:hypothetical protein
MSEAKAAAGDWFADEMEECPWCHEYVHYDDLETLIGTPSICFACRKKEQKRRLADAMEDGLGLA